MSQTFVLRVEFDSGVRSVGLNFSSGYDYCFMYLLSRMFESPTMYLTKQKKKNWLHMYTPMLYIAYLSTQALGI